MESHCLNQSRANLRRVTELAEKNLNSYHSCKRVFQTTHCWSHSSIQIL